VNEARKIGVNDLLPGRKGTITVSSDESEWECRHRIEQDAKDQELKRKHEGLDKDQASGGGVCPKAWSNLGDGWPLHFPGRLRGPFMGLLQRAQEGHAHGVQ